MKHKDYISLPELKYTLKQQGLHVRPSYCHKDHMFTSFSMPYPLKDKLVRISKKYDLSRSKVFQMLIENVDESDFFNSVKKM